jgi:hypothetical protein
MSTEYQYGPWSPTIDPLEQGKQLRSLCAIAHLQLGPNHPLTPALRAAEDSQEALDLAYGLVEALPALTRRRLLSSFAAVTWRQRSRLAPAPSNAPCKTVAA